MEIKWKRGALRILLVLCGMCWVIAGSFQKKGEMPIESPSMGRAGVSAPGAGISGERAEELFSVSEVSGSCVRLQARGHYGSGSIFALGENEITVVTNRHVLEYWDEDSYVTFFNGTIGTGRVIGLSKQADVGFLSIDGAGLQPKERSGLSAVEVSDTDPKWGDWFFMVDMASDVWDPVLYKGQVLEPLKYMEEFGMEMLYGDSAFQAGMSGCGVFDVGGKYLGMLTGGTKQNEIAAVPVDAVTGAYREIGGN